MSGAAPGHPLSRLPAFDPGSGSCNVVIETPRGSRNKYHFDEELGLFVLGGVLPAGAVFPFDFGFIPATLGEDGDPLDVLVLQDDAAFAGCLVPCRLVGVIEASQRERDGEVVRNDRLIAVSAESYNHEGVLEIDQVADSLLKEIEHFFASYNRIKGKHFEPLSRAGARRAEALVREGVARAAEARRTA